MRIGFPRSNPLISQTQPNSSAQNAPTITYVDEIHQTATNPSFRVSHQGMTTQWEPHWIAFKESCLEQTPDWNKLTTVLQGMRNYLFYLVNHPDLERRLRYQLDNSKLEMLCLSSGNLHEELAKSQFSLLISATKSVLPKKESLLLQEQVDSILSTSTNRLDWVIQITETILRSLDKQWEKETNQQIRFGHPWWESKAIQAEQSYWKFVSSVEQATHWVNHIIKQPESYGCSHADLLGSNGTSNLQNTLLTHAILPLAPTQNLPETLQFDRDNLSVLQNGFSKLVWAQGASDLLINFLRQHQFPFIEQDRQSLLDKLLCLQEEVLLTQEDLVSFLFPTKDMSAWKHQLEQILLDGIQQNSPLIQLHQKRLRTLLFRFLQAQKWDPQLLDQFQYRPLEKHLHRHGQHLLRVARVHAGATRTLFTNLLNQAYERQLMDGILGTSAEQAVQLPDGMQEHAHTANQLHVDFWKLIETIAQPIRIDQKEVANLMRLFLHDGAIDITNFAAMVLPFQDQFFSFLQKHKRFYKTWENHLHNIQAKQKAFSGMRMQTGWRI